MMTPEITRDNIVETNMVTPLYGDAQNIYSNQHGNVYNNGVVSNSVYGNGYVQNASNQQNFYYNNNLTNNLNPWSTRGNNGETSYAYNNYM